MKIRALRDYKDLQRNEDIPKGKEYIVTLERGKEIIAKGYAEEIVEQLKEKGYEYKEDSKASTVVVPKLEPKKEHKKKPSFNAKDKMKK